ncbi:uncharacterized protein LOC122366416 [Amphibalanus amphitrite]|uniref:uncharacterized protein LOC122366416 n=1 Tax=Amphibalanus amphitrite TaxID=1232801 RepID=UPI001C91C376|nr:uncharacterized protein LOC122366416 [Amphibalanus amphitrite]
MARVKPSSVAPTRLGGGTESDTESNHSRKTTSSRVSSTLMMTIQCCRINPVSKIGRRIYITQMLLLPFIPIVALIVQNIYSMSAVVIYQRGMLEVKHAIEETTDIGLLLTALQLERSEVAFYIFTNGSTARDLANLQSSSVVPNAINLAKKEKQLETNRDMWRSNLTKVFDFTDLTLEKMSRWEDVRSAVDLKKFPIFSSKLKFQIRLEDLRDTINRTMLEIQDKIDWYTRLNDIFLDVMAMRMSARKLDSSALSYMLSYLNIIRAMEHFSLFLTYGLRYFATGQLQAQFQTQAVRSDTLFWEYINNTRSFSPEMSEKIHYIFDSFEGYNSYIQQRGLIVNNSPMNGSMGMAIAFFINGTTMADLLRDVQVELRNIITGHVTEQVAIAYNQQMVAVLLLVLVLLLSPIIIVLVRKIALTMQDFTEMVTAKTQEIAQERNKADRLLYQMLPEPIAQQLKGKGQVPAEHFQSVTVYFSDIVGFTRISAQSTPIQVVTFLNVLYKVFDSRIDRYDVYKVETIGDAYMCVSGLPKRNGDQHASEVADMSLDLLQGIKKFEVPHMKGVLVQIRIGLNTGPCVAGVVGTKMPRYCLFGDTINVASRMESTGLPQMVHVSDTTYELLMKAGGYKLEFRENVDIKGKGSLPTYWLLGKEGGVGRTLEIDVPGFLDPSQQPEFMNSDVYSQK